ncbi:component of the polarisome [Entomortierella beljakovae]|nr:component of the polarisome [Entomortierella beljakovae]
MSRQQNGQWQPQQPQRPYHPSASSSASLSAQNRSNSPQPTSPVSPGMHINTKTGGQQRSSPSSPNMGWNGNAMEIATRHYEALQQYLLAHILKEKNGVSEQRVAAREKLSRLMQNQLQDLSTDVYDELKRRTDGAQVPFLAVRDDFHPKRNQARQKLATLPQSRFKDLASDVYVQLERQFPTLTEMFPLQALEEKEYQSQPPPQGQSQQDREPTTPVVQQSSVVPNVSTFTIQDNSNVEEEDAYYRSPVQQAPPSPTALDGNVNFASLDSLMADLGNIVNKDSSNSKGSGNKDARSPKDNGSMQLPNHQDAKSLGLGINSSLPADQVKEEYETRITALCKRLQHLESEVGDGINRPEGSRLAQVERQLAKQTELYNEQISKISKLQLDYNKVMNDYHAQLETVDMVNQEVKAFVMENKNLKQRQADAEEELQLAYNRIKQLEDENSDLKADLEDNRHNQKRAPQEDSGARSIVTKESAINSAGPVSPVKSNTKERDSIRQGAESNNNMDWNNDRQQARNSAMVNPGSVVHKESLDSFRNAVDDLLSAGRGDSSSAVLLTMKSVVISCKLVTEDVEDYEHDAQDDSFVDLKQELSSGLTQLMSAAKVHANAFNEDEEEFERTLSDLENAADQLEAIVMDIVNVPKRMDGGNNNNNSSNNNNNSGVNHDGGPNGSNANIGNDDGPMDALDLKLYLENKTGFIVSSIQTLLASLRSSSDPDDISDASENIAKVADQLIRKTRQTLSNPDAVSAPQATELRNQGEMVLEDLENSLDLLIEMKEQVEQNPELAQATTPEAKSVKQKLASASFDIAKFTKELVSLIEE